MRAAVLMEPGRFKLCDVPRPQPGPGEALIRIERCGICGTDMHIFNGHYSLDKLPLIPGHEFAGHIAEIAADVKGLTVGTRVVVDMNIGCGHCYWCRRNEILNCPSMQQMGITIDGAFAEYIAVPARLVIPVSSSIPGEVLALTEPLACVVRAAKKSRIGLGQSVVVLGAGPIGNLHIQLLRTLGAAPIVVAELDHARAAIARDCGADVVLTDPSAVHETVLQYTDGRGADVVIESVGNAALYTLAQTLIRHGGHIAAFGLTGPGETLALDILETVLNENSVKGSVAGMGQDMHDALTLLTHGRIETTPFTGASFPLEDIQAAFDTFPDRLTDLKTQIVLD